MTIDGFAYVCSNCGSPSISPSSVQRGIGGVHYLGLCYDCIPQIPRMPLDEDHSARAEKARRSIARKTVLGTYRTKLTPLVRADQYRPREKPVAATPLSLFGDEP